MPPPSTRAACAAHTSKAVGLARSVAHPSIICCMASMRAAPSGAASAAGTPPARWLEVVGAQHAELRRRERIGHRLVRLLESGLVEAHLVPRERRGRLLGAGRGRLERRRAAAPSRATGSAAIVGRRRAAAGAAAAPRARPRPRPRPAPPRPRWRHCPPLRQRRPDCHQNCADPLTLGSRPGAAAARPRLQELAAAAEALPPQRDALACVRALSSLFVALSRELASIRAAKRSAAVASLRPLRPYRTAL